MIKNLLNHSLACSIIWSCTIFLLCCMPGKYVPTSNWLELLSFDKFVHAFIFFILTTLWFIFFKTKRILFINYQIIIVISCIAYGGFLEIMQATVFSQRAGDWLDFIANCIGCLLSLVLFKFIYKKFIFKN